MFDELYPNGSGLFPEFASACEAKYDTEYNVGFNPFRTSLSKELKSNNAVVEADVVEQVVKSFGCDANAGEVNKS